MYDVPSLLLHSPVSLFPCGAMAMLVLRGLLLLNELVYLIYFCNAFPAFLYICIMYYMSSDFFLLSHSLFHACGAPILAFRHAGFSIDKLFTIKHS